MGMSYDRWLEFLLFILLIRPYIEELQKNSFFRKLNIYILIFALLQLLINIRLGIVGKIELEDIYTQFLKCISYLIFSFLFLLLASRKPNYINIILFVHFIICLFALLQHPISPLAGQMLEVKKFLYSSVTSENIVGKLETEEAYISGGYANRFRLSGPYASAISFSYFAISSFMLTFYMYLKYKKRSYIILLSTIFIASLLTQTRSLILAELFLLAGYFFFIPTRIRGILKTAIVIGGMIASIIVFIGSDILIPENTRITKLSSEGQEDSRPYLWLTGIRAVVEYPIGISQEDYQKVRNEMAIVFGKPYILFLAPHNGLINIGFQYSILGYLVFAFFIIFLLKYIRLLEPKFSLLFKMIIISYLIHCSFHNNFIFLSDYNILLIIMLIGVEYKNFISLPSGQSTRDSRLMYGG